MLSCKDATSLISQSMDRSLPLSRRVGVRFHLMICRFCRRYERQLHLIRDAVRRHLAAEDLPGDPSEALSKEARDRILASLRSS